jgi:hypothetical protein
VDYGTQGIDVLLNLVVDFFSYQEMVLSLNGLIMLGGTESCQIGLF